MEKENLVVHDARPVVSIVSEFLSGMQDDDDVEVRITKNRATKLWAHERSQINLSAVEEYRLPDEEAAEEGKGHDPESDDEDVEEDAAARAKVLAARLRDVILLFCIVLMFHNACYLLYDFTAMRIRTQNQDSIFFKSEITGALYLIVVYYRLNMFIYFYRKLFHKHKGY